MVLRSNKQNLSHSKSLQLAAVTGFTILAAFVVAQQPRPAAEPPFAPIAYFNQACARCHGPEGAFYGEGMGSGLSWTKLRETVKEMAEGPASSPLKADQLNIQTAYHLALSKQEPFGILLSSKSGKLIGEVTSAAQMKVSWKGNAVPVVRDGIEWRLTIPKGAKESELVAELKLAKKTVIWRFSTGKMSHLPPKPVS